MLEDFRMPAVQDSSPALAIVDMSEPAVTRRARLGSLSKRKALNATKKVVRAMVAPSQVGVLAEENSSVEGAIAGAFEDSAGERVLGLRKTQRSNTAVQLCRSMTRQTRAPV